MADLELTLSTTQRAFCEDTHRFVLFLGGIGAGKSYAGAVRALYRFNGQPKMGLVVAPTYPMLRDATWRTAVDIWEPLITNVVKNEMKLVLRGGHEVLFRSADEPDRLRGVNASWAWLDEGAMCHPDTWPILIGRLRQYGVSGDAWVTTTPAGMNWLYDVFVRNATEQTSLHRMATRANPFVDESFVQGLISQYDGVFARQELEAEFIADDAAALIQHSWLLDAQGRSAAYSVTGGPVIAGLDVAGPGTDETVLVIRQGRSILDMQAWPDADAWDWALAKLREWKGRNLQCVNVDSAGIGWGLAREIENDGFTVNRINVGESPSDDAAAERFVNLRAELWWALREQFKEGEIAGLADPVAFAQLASIHWNLNNPRKRIAIEKKADALKRGVKSPDRAEAIMLAFAPGDPTADLGSAFAAASTSNELDDDTMARLKFTYGEVILPAERTGGGSIWD